MRKHLSHRLRELLIAATSFLASASTALAQELVTPAEVVLYIQSEMKSTDFVQPLVCALQRVLTAPVLTKTLDLRLGPGLRATPTQFDVGKVADLFIQTTAADGGARSFKYLLIPYDLKAKPWNYVFATSFANKSTPYHVGVLSTARTRRRQSDATAPRRQRNHCNARLQANSQIDRAGRRSQEVRMPAFLLFREASTTWIENHLNSAQTIMPRWLRPES